MENNVQKQPKGLKLLFFTELWERFGFYTVQTIIILYLSKHFLLNDSQAYLTYGVFSSMLYLTPVVGGYLADRFLGFRQAVFIGGVLLVLGYFVLVFPQINALYIGLSIVIIGNGFFKPNISTMLGELYEHNDPRREAGFTYFYMGINLGSLLPPLFAGALVAAFTWSAGFFVAACGMIVSLLIFFLGKHVLKEAGKVPLISPLRKKRGGEFYLILFLGIFFSVTFIHLLFSYPIEADLILVIAAIVVISIVLTLLFKERPEQKRKLGACLILILISVGFWSLYNQMFTSLMLFADRNVNKELFGFSFNTEFTQFFNPFFIVCLSPLLSVLWLRLDKGKKNPSTPLKFSLGILLMAFGFFALWIGSHYPNSTGEIALEWLIFSYFLQTIGELFLSPIGLAMVTKLSPRHLVGMMMGVWFLTQSAAFAIGGGLATLSNIPINTPKETSLSIYSHAFLVFTMIAVALAIISFILVPYLNKLIGNVEGPIPSVKE